MKAVLISIQPKWCHKIIDGEKKIEVRKTKPKLATPFKVYIYCSAGSYDWRKDPWTTAYFPPSGECTNMSQMVIGEFVCNKVDSYIADDFVGAENLDGTIRTEPVEGDFAYWIPEEKDICVSYDEILKYGKGKTLYGWHISDLKIYDKPRELSEFASFCMVDEKSCASCEHYLFDSDDVNGYRRWCGVYRRKPLTHPPQSWMYVEELQE